jgi:hypothetical protein
MTALSLRKFHLLAVLAQSAAAVVLCTWVFQVLPIWWVLRTLDGPDSLKPELIAASALATLAVVSVIALRSEKAWGWSCALLVNLAATLVLVLGVISGSRPPSQLAVSFAILIAANAVMTLPGVRACYSQHTRPWPLTWWQRKRENEREQLVRLAFAIGQLAVCLSGWILLLVFLPNAQWLGLLPFGFLGTAASAHLFRGSKSGPLLTLTWALLGLLAIANADPGHPAPLQGGGLYLAVFFLVNGFYASATLARRFAHRPSRRPVSGQAQFLSTGKTT